jgi:hypothetical protein
LRQEIRDYAGANASNIQIFVDETNSVSSNPGKQTTSIVNALFMANDYMNWLRSGVANVSWWALHNGAAAGNASSSLYGTTQYGDYGILSNGSSINGISEPPPETPFPTYYAYKMLSILGRPGDTMVQASTNQSLVKAYAVRQSDGNMAVMVVNSDPNNNYNLNLDLAGYRVSRGPIAAYSYGENSAAISQSFVGSHQTLTVAPYSINTYILHVLPSPPPFAGARVSDSTTLSSPSVTPGQTQTVTSVFTADRGAVPNATLELGIYNSAGQQVGQYAMNHVNLLPHQSQTVTFKWTAPNAPDAYTVKAFVFNQDTSKTYMADQNAASFMINPPPAPTSFTTSATLNGSTGPITVSPGQAITMVGTFTNTSTNFGYLEEGMLDMEVHNSSGAKVGQSAYVGTLAPGQSVTETWNYTAPTTPGTYTLQMGVFSAGWSTNYEYNFSAGTIIVN